MRSAPKNVGKVPSWVWAVLVLVHLGFLIYSVTHHSWFFPDTDRYIAAGQNLREYGELYARPWPATAPSGQAIQEFTIRPPGYPLFLSVLGVEANSVQPVWVLLVQSLLSMLNLGWVLIYWAKRAEPSAKQWAASLFLLLFPGQFIYANAVMSEIVLQTVVLGLAGLGAGCLIRPTGMRVAGLALSTCLAFLLKPVFYLLAFVLPILILGLAWQHRRVVWSLMGIVPLAVLLLYMQWNEQRTGYFHFSSIAEINLLHYNAAGVVRQVEGKQAEDRWVADVLAEANAQLSFRQRQLLIQHRATDVLKAHPVVYLRQQVQGMLAFFLDPGRFDIARFLSLNTGAGGLLEQMRGAGMRGLLEALWKLPLGFLALLALIAVANATRLGLAIRGFWRAHFAAKELKRGRWCLAGLILYVALLTGPLGAARFLVPVWPLLLLLALWGVKMPGIRAEQGAPVRQNEG